METPLVFTAATKNDVSRIAQCHANSWKLVYRPVLHEDFLETGLLDNRLEVWQTRLNEPSDNQGVWLAHSDGIFCGFICVYGNWHETYGSIIDNLHVVEGFKGQGIGQKLIRHGCRWLAQRYPTTPVYLEVLACNPKAIGFYEYLGGKYVGDAVWHTPCNTDAKELLYQWQSPDCLIEAIRAKSFSVNG